MAEWTPGPLRWAWNFTSLRVIQPIKHDEVAAASDGTQQNFRVPLQGRGTLQTIVITLAAGTPAQGVTFAEASLEHNNVTVAQLTSDGDPWINQNHVVSWNGSIEVDQNDSILVIYRTLIAATLALRGSVLLG